MKVFAALLLATSLFAQVKPNAIREADFATAMRDVLAATYDDTCEDTGRSPTPEIAQKTFGDLDGDGIEEAAVTAYSCFSGTGGADLFAVFKLQPNGNLKRLQLDADFTRPLPPFKGRNVAAGIRGHMSISIDSTPATVPELRVLFPLYEDSDANCCPSAGSREFIFRSDGKKLVLRDVRDLPAASGASARRPR
jgi:hypothetical protein